MCDENELVNRAKQFAECLLSDNKIYHNHKETMAHACVVLEIALFGWIMSKDEWAIVIDIGWIKFLLVLIGIWLPLHLYMRWELRNRRWSAIQDIGIRVFLARCVTKPKIQDFQPFEEKIQYPDCYCFSKLIDHVIPFFRGGLQAENSAHGYPIALVKALRNAARDKNWSLYFGEWLPSFLSLFLLGILLVRISTDC